MKTRLIGLAAFVSIVAAAIGITFLGGGQDSAYAATTGTLTPTGVGFYSDWTVVGTGAIGGDCSTNYITNAVSGSRSSFTVNISSIPNGATITNVAVTAGDRGDTTGGSWRAITRINGADSDPGVSITNTTTSGTCNIRPAQDIPVNVVKSGATTLEVGVWRTGNGVDLRIGALTAVVTYVNGVTGPNSVVSSSTCTNVTGVGTAAWSTPSNAATSNDSDTTVGLADNEISNYLRCLGYGFSVPAGATIDGIQVDVERSWTGSGSPAADSTVRLVKAGTITGSNLQSGTNWTGTDTYETYGGASNLWGTTWTVSDVNNANFGIAFSARKAGTSGSGDITARVDHMRITVYYTLSQPDLTVTKTNNAPGGNVAMGGSFNWVLTVANTGTASATFTTGQAMLLDNLPNANATYGAVTAVNGSGSTGTTSCSISGTFNLTCSASGGSVVIPVNGTITITVPTTVGATPGALANPRAAGACSIDSSSLITESNEGNNTCSNTVTVTAPDFQVSKANNVSSTVAQNGSFNWILVMSNQGGATGTFTTGQTLLSDNLPNTNATYGTVTAVNGSGASGTTSCSIATSNLTCTASGGSVVLPVNGTITVTVPVTVGAQPGAMDNPRSGGACSIDPTPSVTESNEGNNACPSNTVTVTGPDFTLAKTSNLATVNVNSSFNWILNVSNGGTANGVFNAGNTILTDNLPTSNATYGTPVVTTTGVTGTGSVDCSIAGNDLACTASGGTVIVGTGTNRITVTIPVTSGASTGTLVNPRGGGACSVDGGLAVLENNESNNSCTTNTVTVVSMVVNSADFSLTSGVDTNDAATITAGPSANIYPDVTATISSGATWGSSSIAFDIDGPGGIAPTTAQCDDHSNFTGAGSFTIEDLNTTAPTSSGTYDVIITIYTTGTACNTPPTATLTLTQVVTVDATPPAVVIDSALPSPTDSGTTVTWHANDNGPFSVRVGGTTCSNGTVVTSGSYSTQPGTISTPIAASFLSTGANTIRVCVADSYGNTGNATTSVTRNTPNAVGGTATCVDDSSGPSGSSVTWSTPGNAQTSNNSYATAVVDDNLITHYLKCTNFGFSLPPTVTVTGIVADVEVKSSSTVTQDHTVVLLKAGSIVGSNLGLNTDYPTSDTVQSHGGTGNLWGTTWTPSDINNSGFGISLASYKNSTSGTTRTISVDDITLTVYYSTATFPVVTIDSVTPNPTPSDTVLTWHADQNGTYSVRIGGTDCSDGTVIASGTYNTSPATVGTAITGSQLAEGPNTAFVCVANLAVDTGSASTTVTKTTPNVFDATATCTSDASSGGIAGPWSTPGSAGDGSNDTRATVTVDDNQTTHYLRCVNFGPGVPANATILGIVVGVERLDNRSTQSPATDSLLRLIKGGITGTTDRAGTLDYTNSDVTELHGSSTDLWGTTWTPAQINAADFGVAFAAKKTNTTGGTFIIGVDSISVRVYYIILAPPAPTVTSVSPVGPANNNNPKVVGSAQAASTVNVYTNSTCTSAVAATGTAAAFASPGLTVTVADNSTTSFWATATDAGTSPCSSTSTTYIEDSLAPVSTISFPVNGTSYNVTGWNAGCGTPGVGDICGTSSDANSVASVGVSIKRNSDNLYWNGSSFASAVEVFNGATGTTSWSLALAAAALTDGSTYTIHARGTDGVGNVEASPILTFTFDNTPPIVACGADILGVEATSPAGAVVSWGAGQCTGSDATDLAITDCNESPASGSTFPLGTTTVTCSATDAAGNTGSDTFDVEVVDTTAPTVTCGADFDGVEATSPAGAPVIWPPTQCQASDVADATVTDCLEDYSSGSIFPLGTTTVTCSVTDVSGNSNSDDFDVEVVDTTSPDVLCDSDIVEEATSPAGAVVTWDSDRCTASDIADTGVIDCVEDATSGDTFPITTTTVTCEVTDASGNTGSDTFDVIVQDTTAPDVICGADIGPIEATSASGVEVTWDSDQCTASDVADDGVLDCAETPASGDTFPIGITTVTCEVTDAYSNTGSDTFDVEVVDTTSPEVVCGADILGVEATSPAGAIVTWGSDQCVASDIGDGGVTDCVETPASGDTFPLGTTTVTCEVTDNDGNTGSDTFDVEVVDTTSPDVICDSDIGPLEATSPAGAVASWGSDQCTASDIVDTGVTDCVESANSGDTFPLGTTTVTCEVTDVSGNTGSDSFDVGVVDTTAPTVTCGADIPGVEATSPFGAEVTWATDQCEASDIADDTVLDCTETPPSGDTFPLGTTTVTCEVTDASSNSNSDSFDVEVVDTTAPTVTCGADFLAVEATSPAGAEVTWDSDQCTASDIADDTVLDCVETSNSGDTFPIGTTTVTCEITDASSNSNSDSFDVQVVDTTGPEVICDADIFAEATNPAGAVVTWDSDQCTASDIADPGVTDCVENATSGETYPIGITTVICIVSDTYGNPGGDAFNIIVEDTTPPEVICGADIGPLEATSPAGATATWDSDQCTASDIADPAITDCTESANSGDTFPLGTTTVTCEVTDADGNTGSDSFDVIVEDTTNPEVACGADITGVEATSPAGAEVTWDADQCTASDIADAAVLDCVETPASGDTFPLGTTTVTCEVTDASGNTNSATFDVEVVDTTSPTVTCGADITGIEATSPAGAPVSWGAEQCEASDIADATVLDCVETPASGDTFPIGTTTVTCEVTDNDGNTGSDTFDVQVVDTTSPEVVCGSDIGPLEATSAAGAVATWDSDQCTASDIADPAVIDCLESANSGDTFPIGATTVTCEVTDAYGNTGSDSFDVIVEDTTAPEVVCGADITGVEATSPAGATVTWDTDQCTASDIGDAGVIDCVETPASGDTFPIGTTTVTCEVTDNDGNTGSDTFDVEVVDTTSPEVVCGADILGVEATSASGAEVTWASDQCTASDIADDTVLDCVETPASGDTFPIGTTTVTCEVTDIYGNTGSDTFDVEVVDTTSPEVVCGADITGIEATSSAGATVSWDSDQCTASDVGDDTVLDCVETPASGDTFPIGTTTVTCEVTDNDGNTGSDTFDVEVVDTTSPEVVCGADITGIEATSPAGAEVTWDSDQCTASDIADDGVLDCVETPASGDTFPLGTTPVTCSVTDSYGNEGSDTFDVEVVDTTEPTVVCGADVLGVEATSAAGAEVTWDSDQCTASDIADDTVLDCVETPASGSTFPIGTTTVTCEVTDASGNTGSDTFDVEVVDTTAPTVVCGPDIIGVEATSPAGATVTWDSDQCTASDTGDAGITDCVETPSSGDTFPLGTTTVTCEVTDSDGNTGSDTFDVQVVDTTSPEVICGGDITGVEATSAAGAAVTWGPEQCEASDIADDFVLDCVETPASGDTFPIGTTTVTCEVTDASGNTGSDTFDVTVVDSTAPTVVCGADILGIEATSPAGAEVTWDSDQCTASDIGDAAVLDCVETPASGSTFPIGTTTVTCEVTDNDGNTGSDTFDVEVVDTTAPEVVCGADILGVEATSAAGAEVTWDSDQCTASDIADDTVLDCVETPASGSTFPIGTTTVTCEVTDIYGNTGSDSFDVQVVDSTAPTVVCGADILGVEATSASGAEVTWDSDQCTASDIGDDTVLDCVETPASGDTFPIGTTTVTCEVTDIDGNTGSDTFDVQVVDTTSPEVTCGADILGVEATSPAGADVTWDSDQCTASDIGDDTVLDCVETPASGDTFPLGTTTVTCEVTDNDGNTGSDTFDVEVVDTTAPEVTCGADILGVEATSASGAEVTWDADQCTASDIADDLVIDCVETPASGDTFPIGTTTVTCEVTDASGNTGSDTFDVQVVDTTAPIVTCGSDITGVEATSPAGAIVSWGPEQCTAFDDGDATVTDCTEVPASGDTFPLGTTTVTCSATDTDGNTSSDSFDVTVADTTSPDVVCDGDITGVEATSSAGAVVSWDGDQCTASDIADDLVLDCVETPASGDTFPIGTTTVTCEVTDASGNTGSDTFDVEVVDTTAPTVVCGLDIGPVEATSAAGAEVTWDNDQCTASDIGDDTVLDCTETPASGSTFPIGTTTVTCEVTDASGNSASDDFDVTVEDSTAPTVVCGADITGVEATSPAGAEVTWDADQCTASDTGDDSVTDCTESETSGDTFPLGTTTVTCEVTDNDGNTGSDSFDIEVVDTTAPEVLCGDDITGIEATSPAGAEVTWDADQCTASDIYDTGVTDCVETPASGDTFPIGTTTVTCEVTDGEGNTGSDTFLVIVQDATAPDVTCGADIGPIEATSPSGAAVTWDAGQCTATDTGDAGITDCTEVPASGDTFPIGTTTVICSVTDSDGNTGADTFDVEVVDTTSPDVTCGADVGPIEATAASGATVTWAADQCSASDIADPAVTDCVETPASGSEFPIGTTTVTCEVTDAYGNTGSATFDVIVSDTGAPSVACGADITGVEATSSAGAVVVWGSSQCTASDIDGVTDCTEDPSSGSTFPLGTTTVTCTATDGSGNSAFATFSVTVVDTTAPTVNCGSNIGPVDATTLAGAIVSWSASQCTASDIADAAVTDCVEVPSSGSQFATGTTTVNCSVTDASGNSASDSFDVTVVDRAPTVICGADITTPATDETGATVTWNEDKCQAMDDSDPAVVDCEETPASGSFFPLGTTTVTCEVTDGAGNTSSDTFDVIVTEFVATPTPSPTPGPSLIWGDVDCNGAVSITDALKVSRWLIDLPITQAPGCPAIGDSVIFDGTPAIWGDVDCSGTVSITDALKISRWLIDLPITQAVDCPPLGTVSGAP